MKNHQCKIPAVFVRGGTSKGVFFQAKHIPAAREARDRIFLQILGSPDPYQRQLDGMGGGLSSVSKVVIIEPSTRPDIDIDYTFVQIAVDRAIADYAQACGNLSAAVGPYALEEGLIQSADGQACVRVYNTNTNKRFNARFEVRDGLAVETGDYEMSGVAGTGAKIRLDYLDPGGTSGAGFLPSGNVVDTFWVEGYGTVQASLVDATNPVVFVDAVAMGIVGTETPEALETEQRLMGALERIRREAGVVMGLGDSPETVPLSAPKIAMLSAPRSFTTISGTAIDASEYDIGIRIVSMERMHRAVTGTGGMCLAAACQVTGSLAHRLVRTTRSDGEIRIASPSGIVSISAKTRADDGHWSVDCITVYRTQRRLMEGHVLLPRG